MDYTEPASPPPKADYPLELLALRRCAEGQVGSQRGLAASLGVSLGKANFVARALVARGLLTLRRVRGSSTRIRYLYVLTPKGVAVKAMLARKFLQQKVAEYERLQVEIAELRREIADGGRKGLQ